MSDLTLAREIAFILGMAFLGGFVAVSLKIPSLIGYLFSGVISSIIFPDIIKSANIVTLSEVGVALLMFSLGIEFSFRRLLRVKGIVISGAVLQILSFTVLGLFLFNLLGFDFYTSLFLAAVFSLSSTAVVVKILAESGELSTHPGEIMVGWLLIQDLAVLPMSVVLSAVARIFLGGGQEPALLVLLGAILKAAFFLYLFLFFGKRVVPNFIAKVARVNSRELLLLAVFSAVLIFAFVSKALGLSFALGAFIAGALISDSSENHAIFSEIRPLRDVFSIIFFVFLGLLFSPTFFISHLTQILLVTILVLLLKFLVTLGLCLFHNLHINVSFLVAAGLVQVGEFAFVLATDALSKSYISVDTYSLILSVAVLSFFLTPLIFKYSFKGFVKIREFSRLKLPKIYDRVFAAIPIETTKEGLPVSSHVVLCGHGRVGHQISRILDLAKISYVVVDYNQNVVRKLREKGQQVVYGDPCDIDVLDFAQVDKASTVVIALSDRHSQEMVIANSLRLNPRINIICRSHFEEDKERLLSLGAKSVIQPEFEAGLSISFKILELFGYSSEDSVSFLKLLRSEAGMK